MADETVLNTVHKKTPKNPPLNGRHGLLYQNFSLLPIYIFYVYCFLVVLVVLVAIVDFSLVCACFGVAALTVATSV